MNDETDPPIEAQNFLGGVTVVDIGDVRVARGLSRRYHSSCPHTRVIYDDKERRIWCKDCEHDVEPFDAFTMVAGQIYKATEAIKRREAALISAENFSVRLIATKVIEEAWRSRNMVPACPHCQNGLFPEDFKRRPTMLGKDYALARLAREKLARKGRVSTLAGLTPTPPEARKE